jgi:geranylgeranyl diphosphate synthase type II
MNFKEFTDQYKPLIYDKICEYVPMKEPTEHYRIARDYIDRQGKYGRCSLLMLTALMFGTKADEAILPAAAMQLSEDWILVQDDWEDDSVLRRGKPAAHRIYGPIHAINSTNTGQMAMWRMLKDYTIKHPEKGDRLYEKFYKMLEYTVEGQYVENKFIHDTKDLGSASEELYLRIVESKTCYYTIYGPMQLGAITGGAEEKQLEVLREIGHATGVAFQIVDDILDLTADEKVFGKKNNGDLYEGKLTIPIMHTYELATPEEKAKLDVIYRKKRQEKTEDEIQYIRQLMDKYDGIGYAQKMVEHYGNIAKETLKNNIEVFPDNEYRAMLESAMESMYIRKK